jgi:hypothetical protein
MTPTYTVDVPTHICTHAGLHTRAQVSLPCPPWLPPDPPRPAVQWVLVAPGNHPITRARRVKVLEMRNRGLPATVIAAKVGSYPHIIADDFAAMRPAT